MSEWYQKFSPAERALNGDIKLVSNSAEWVFYTGSGLLGTVLFVLAANRQRQGDVLGAGLSFIGAIVVSLAPFLATKFLFG